MGFVHPQYFRVMFQPVALGQKETPGMPRELVDSTGEGSPEEHLLTVTWRGMRFEYAWFTRIF